jgi:hypothetical protein
MKIYVSVYLIFLVAIQCLESAYSIDTQDESHIAKYQVQRNLLDIFNSQISSEVSQILYAYNIINILARSIHLVYNY